MYKKMYGLVAVAAGVLFVCGCQGPGKNKNELGMWGDDPGMTGTDIMDGGAPILGDGSRIPTDLNRSMFDAVMFPYDSSAVSPAEAPKVEAVADYLNSHSGGVVVEGHGDERGSFEYNMALGERRAQAVREYLIGLGVDPVVVQTSSKGEEEPAVAGHDENAWRANRRAVFGIYE